MDPLKIMLRKRGLCEIRDAGLTVDPEKITLTSDSVQFLEDVFRNHLDVVFKFYRELQISVLPRLSRGCHITSGQMILKIS